MRRHLRATTRRAHFGVHILFKVLDPVKVLDPELNKGERRVRYPAPLESRRAGLSPLKTGSAKSRRSASRACILALRSSHASIRPYHFLLCDCFVTLLYGPFADPIRWRVAAPVSRRSDRAHSRTGSR